MLFRSRSRPSLRPPARPVTPPSVSDRPPLLEIRGLRAAVGDLEILRGVDLCVHAGEIHAVMGRNGSGKSTLSKVIAGHPSYRVTAGQILYRGQDVADLAPEERARAGLFLGFQYPVEIPGVSNREFLRVATNARRLACGEEELDTFSFDDHLEQRLALVQMDPSFLDRSLNEGFSGGEKKRNEILQMALLEPAVAILDETDSGLDIDALRIVAEGVRQLAGPANATVLITHYQRLLDAITPHTRLLVINSPNNPTGWTLTREEQEAILARCRQTGTWLLADEVYEQLYYVPSENRCAPSFLDIAHSQDRLVVAHSFSKGFLMTGWRLGWLVMPESMTEHMGKLIEFNTSCASVFVQRAGEVALAHAQDIVPPVVAHMRACRDLLCQALAPIPGVVLAEPAGGMYAFFSIQGLEDDFEIAKRWVAEAGLGLAPGSAFDDNAKGWYRWCFASKDTQRLLEGVQRLGDWLAKL